MNKQKLTKRVLISNIFLDRSFDDFKSAIDSIAKLIETEKFFDVEVEGGINKNGWDTKYFVKVFGSRLEYDYEYDRRLKHEAHQEVIRAEAIREEKTRYEELKIKLENLNLNDFVEFRILDAKYGPK